MVEGGGEEEGGTSAVERKREREVVGGEDGGGVVGGVTAEVGVDTSVTRLPLFFTNGDTRCGIGMATRDASGNDSNFFSSVDLRAAARDA